MYSGFAGTVLSHFLSLISTLWAIFSIHNCALSPPQLYYIYFGFFLIAANSCLSLIRYGSSDGYKLRRLHIITLNVSVILHFTIIEAVFLSTIKSSWLSLCLPALNVFPLLINATAKDYRTKNKPTDIFIAINMIFLLLTSFMNENYQGVALSLSYFFGYFVIGESGYFLDTEVPSIDAFQYVTCFHNYFTLFTFSN